MSALPHRLADGLPGLPAELTRALRTGRQMVDDRRDAIEGERFPTGAEPLDRLLRGGVARGQTVELVAWGSSGRFSAVLGALAQATARGDAAALIDLGDGLDPQSARNAGIELERLLWARPRKMKEALLAAEAVLAAGVPFVVLDLGVPPVPGGRGVEAFWLRLARAAESSRVALLVASPYRVTGTAADVVIELGERRAAWTGRGLEPRLLDGLAGRLDLAKGPGWQRAGSETLEWRAPSSVVEPSPEKEEETSDAGNEAENEPGQGALFTASKLRAVAGGRSKRSRKKNDAPPADPLMRRERPKLRMVDPLDPVPVEATA